MGRSINFVLHASACAAMAAMLLVASCSPVSAAAPARAHPCASLDAACLDFAYFDACAQPGWSLERCLAWNSELWTAYRKPGSTAAVGVALAGSHYRLAELADSPELEKSHLDLVRRISLDVADAHPDSNSEAYGWLAILDHDQPARRVEWLRRSVAGNPTNWQVERLISTLKEVNTVEAYQEAIEVARANYDRTPVGTARWEHAATAWRTYASAASRFPELAGAERRLFEQRVRADSEWDEAVRIASSPSVESNLLRDALRTVCSPLKEVFDDRVCIRGLETAMQGARTSEPAEAQSFADTVSEGIVIFRPSRSIVEPAFSWNDVFARWLDELSDLQLESVRFHEARIWVGGAGRDGILKSRLAILKLQPDSAEAWFEVGKAQFDLKRWKEAHASLETARRLSNDQKRNYIIESYLRQAAYEVNAAR